MDFESFLEFEEKFPVLEFRLGATGLLCWPLVRSLFIMAALSSEQGLETAHARTERHNFSDYFTYGTQTLFNSVWRAKPKECMILSSGVVNLFNGTNFENRLYDVHLRRSREKINLFEDSYRFKYRRPRAERVFYTDLLYIEADVHSKPKKTGNNRSVDSFLESIKEKFPGNISDAQITYIKDFLLRFERRYPFIIQSFERLFDKLSPRMVILEDASYGSRPFILIAARKRGIVTAEFQHGYIGRAHAAYNHATALLQNEEYRTYFPQYFFTFGDYWSNRIRIPGKTVSMGYPYLDDKAIEKNKKEIDILIITDANRPKIFSLLTNKILEKYKKAKIVLKVHPGEVPFLNERYGDIPTSDKFRIATNESVYDLLARSKKVVGATSTVMYEAIKFTQEIYVLDDDRTRMFMDCPAFISFTDVPELDFSENHPRKKEIDVEYYWKKNGCITFQDFLDSISRK